ncbi:hypothetical protein ACQCVP_11890 [Rossellomorea vietnamensis]|uniref:hypothetical protein n=1 Tax=Rossellomorea vietnamensis TaxID=218284 RepID=UPI003CEC1DBE
MVLTKYIKEGVYLTDRRFLYANILGWFLKSNLSQSEKNVKVNVMKFADHLSREQIQKFNQMRKKQQKTEEKQKKPVKVKEQLSRKDWEEIMGTKRDTYKRVGGAVKRR